MSASLSVWKTFCGSSASRNGAQNFIKMHNQPHININRRWLCLGLNRSKIEAPMLCFLRFFIAVSEEQMRWILSNCIFSWILTCVVGTDYVLVQSTQQMTLLSSAFYVCWYRKNIYRISINFIFGETLTITGVWLHFGAYIPAGGVVIPGFWKVLQI